MAKIARKITKADFQKLPDAVQALYTEKGGDYLLDADDADELRAALDRERTEHKAAKTRLEALKDIDPEQHRKLIEEATKAQRQRDLDEKNFQKVLDEESVKSKGEISKRDEQITRLLGELEAEKVDGELTRAISAYQGAKPKLILPAAKQVVKLREVGGVRRAVVLDEKGNPRLKADAKDADDFMGPADLIAEMRNDKEYAGAFPASNGRETSRPLMSTPTDPRSQHTMQTVNALADQIRAGSKGAP